MWVFEVGHSLKHMVLGMNENPPDIVVGMPSKSLVVSRFRYGVLPAIVLFSSYTKSTDALQPSLPPTSLKQRRRQNTLLRSRPAWFVHRMAHVFLLHPEHLTIGTPTLSAGVLLTRSYHLLMQGANLLPSPFGIAGVEPLVPLHIPQVVPW